VDANGPVIGRISPILTVSAWASASVDMTAGRIDAATAKSSAWRLEMFMGFLLLDRWCGTIECAERHIVVGNVAAKARVPFPSGGATAQPMREARSKRPRS